MDLKEMICMWNGFIWLRIESSDGFVWCETLRVSVREGLRLTRIYGTEELEGDE